MKKLIALIVAVVVILIVLKMTGVDIPLPSKPSSNNENKEIYYPYQLSQEGNTYKDIIGTTLPKSAVDIRGPSFYVDCPDDGPTTYKYNWIVVTLQKEDFYNLVKELNLKHKADLLEIWPKAFDCKFTKFDKFWDLEKTVNEDTYFSEDPDKKTYRLFKYENGKLYVKRITEYIGFIDENREFRYKIVKKE